METLFHADVFFLVTTIFVFVLTVVLTVSAFYFIQIMRNLRDISDKAKIEGGEIMEDMKNLRENIKIEGKSLKHIFRFFYKLFDKNKSK